MVRGEKEEMQGEMHLSEHLRSKQEKCLSGFLTHQVQFFPVSWHLNLAIHPVVVIGRSVHMHAVLE